MSRVLAPRKLDRSAEFVWMLAFLAVCSSLAVAEEPAKSEPYALGSLYETVTWMGCADERLRDQLGVSSEDCRAQGIAVVEACGEQLHVIEFFLEHNSGDLSEDVRASKIAAESLVYCMTAKMLLGDTPPPSSDNPTDSSDEVLVQANGLGEIRDHVSRLPWADLLSLLTSIHNSQYLDFLAGDGYITAGDADSDRVRLSSFEKRKILESMADSGVSYLHKAYGITYALLLGEFAIEGNPIDVNVYAADQSGTDECDDQMDFSGSGMCLLGGLTYKNVLLIWGPD